MRFKRPKIKEIHAYCLERNNGIDPEEFFDFYEANGWVQGKARKPIKNWQACVRTWERSRRNNPQFKSAAAPVHASHFQAKAPEPVVECDDSVALANLQKIRQLQGRRRR